MRDVHGKFEWQNIFHVSRTYIQGQRIGADEGHSEKDLAWTYL